MVQIKIKHEPVPEKEEKEEKREREIQRFKIGISALDSGLEGGIPFGSWVVISGEPGTGKTILTQHAVKSAIDQNFNVVVVSTELKKWEWMEQVRSLGLAIPESAVIRLDDIVNYTVRKGDEKRLEIELDTSKLGSANVIFIDIHTLSSIAKMLTHREEERKKWYSYLDTTTLSSSIELALRAFARDESRSPSIKTPTLLVVDSLSMFYLRAPSMSAKYLLDLSIRFKRYSTVGLFTAQYAMTTRSTFGFRLEHIADGVFHFWMENVETAKEIRRYMIIKKMRMTDHSTTAFLVKIVKGTGMILEPLKR